MWQHIHRLESLPPLALFWGDGDDIIPVSHAHDAARRLGDVMVKIYAGCGHSRSLRVSAKISSSSSSDDP
jgi:pimeloyl-ACP methyl ester carboxylesterase